MKFDTVGFLLVFGSVAILGFVGLSQSQLFTDSCSELVAGNYEAGFHCAASAAGTVVAASLASIVLTNKGFLSHSDPPALNHTSGDHPGESTLLQSGELFFKLDHSVGSHTKVNEMVSVLQKACDSHNSQTVCIPVGAQVHSRQDLQDVITFDTVGDVKDLVSGQHGEVCYVC